MVYGTQFFHRPVFCGVETQRFGNWICFRPQVKGVEDTYSVGHLRKSYPVTETSSTSAEPERKRETCLFA
jgi:hypothetical protein